MLQSRGGPCFTDMFFVNVAVEGAVAGAVVDAVGAVVFSTKPSSKVGISRYLVVPECSVTRFLRSRSARSDTSPY